jgi:hypothetical protein
MVKEEIVAGLRNAVERGQSINQAMQSMTNAGYQLGEVQEASRYVNMGATGIMQQTPQIYVTPTSTPGMEQPANQQVTPTKSSPKTKVIILSLILILLLAGMGIIIYFMLKP